jgi:hypothetical protein
MADEITFNFSLVLANGALDSFQLTPGTVSIDQNTAVPVRVDGSQIIGFAAHEALTVTDITTLGVCAFWNRDATNFVQIGVDVGATFYPVVRVNPGEVWPFRMAQGITPYAKADTGNVVLQRLIMDD